MSARELMIGKILKSVEESGERITLTCTDGSAFLAYHMQDCCESVEVWDTTGKFVDLIGKPLVAVSESESGDWPEDVAKPGYPHESFTWTTHVFETADAKVRVRWLGTSNGYYGEGVYLELTHPPIEVHVDGT